MSVRLHYQSLIHRDLRFSPGGFRFSPEGLRFSPKGLRFSPRGLRFSPEGLRFSPRVFVLVHGVLGLGSSFLGLRFRNTQLSR